MTTIFRRSSSTTRRIAVGLVGCVLVWLAVAYLLLPWLWRGYIHRHPALQDLPGITTTANGIPGDPLNLAIIGSKAELVRAMTAIEWRPADPLSLKSSLEIAEATVLHREYPDAPVSNLFLWGRKEDLAFEQPAGNDPRRRHHVRFWKSDKLDEAGRPLWAGAVTFDKSVGLSHTTGQITHHVDAQVDVERDRLMGQLLKANWTAPIEYVDGFHKTLSGKNGGGDPWQTDGRLAIARLKAPGS